MNKEGLGNLILTGYIESKNDSGKQRMTYLTGLCKCLAERGLGEFVTNLLRASKDSKLRKAMITHEHGS